MGAILALLTDIDNNLKEETLSIGVFDWIRPDIISHGLMNSLYEKGLHRSIQ